MKVIIDLLSKHTKLDEISVEKLLEVPPKMEMGDFAFPCFSLAKSQNKSPVEIAKKLLDELSKNLPDEIMEVRTLGPYVNFFVNKIILSKKVFEKVFSENFGSFVLDEKKIGIEYPAPNTNKSLHIGHLRNMTVGEAVSNISRNAGNEVFHLNLFNDRGILISKSMIGYEKYALGKTPESEGVKGDKFVGDLYVKFSIDSEKNLDLEEEAKEKLRLWESGDETTVELWKKMNSWTYSGMQETFEKFGLSKIDKNYYESEMYKEGREIVEDGLRKGLFFRKDDGAVAIDLSDENLGEKILLRNDGTSVYITQDLFLAEKKVNDFNLDSSYYVVGSDQEYHFKVLFSILEKLGIRKDWKHLSYGMVSLPTGKMKSRMGTAVGADELIDETSELAKVGIKERLSEEMSEEEIERRALVIALAAIKYTLLKVDIHKGIIFNPKDAISFEGDTGPYLLYSYARANSIIKKVGQAKEFEIHDLEDLEIKLIKKIDNFDEVFRRAYIDLAPNLIANYAFELAQLFNEFYHSCPVMSSDKKDFRLKLVESFKITLDKILDLLGIEKLEEM